MKLSRIDQIALNGGDGAHYKYEDVAGKIFDLISVYDYSDPNEEVFNGVIKEEIAKILVENFPDDATK